MTEQQTTSTTIAALDPKIRGVLAAIAEQHSLPADLSDTIACCATTMESKVGLLGKLFGGGGPSTSVAILTRGALLWAVAHGAEIVANGGRLRDIELRPIADIPHADPNGLHVHGALFRGAAERASAYVALGPGDTSAAFRNAVAEALTKR